jgi:hypothetical protein
VSSLNPSSTLKFEEKRTFQMKKEELTREQIISVPCPTCGVAAGVGCILYSGGLRFAPHSARKLSALETLERMREVHAPPVTATSK